MSHRYNEIQKGDRIKVVNARGYTDTGVVESAINYGRFGENDWYIEYLSDTYGACYIKQVQDGVKSVERIQESA